MSMLGMKRLLLGTVAAAGLALASAAAQAAPVFVGSWIVGDGPIWFSNPPVYSGVEAAALLFGGSPSDYAISTVDSNPANINNMAYADTWGGDIAPVAEDYSLSLCGGTYDCGFEGSATSAYVLDHSCFNRYDNPAEPCTDFGTEFVNYAFRITDVPEPATATLLLTGLLAAGGVWRLRRRQD
jgi:hypothetical protein